MYKQIVTLALACCIGTAAAQAQTSTTPKGKVYMVADAHLDTQWNWDVQTTINDYVSKTIRQNLYLLGKYPNYIFNFEGAVKYAWMKEYYPQEYELVKKYIANGRWHLAGSSWDANETVICSPESWLRNILLGQTFYRQEFQKEGIDVFLPDCFGFGYDMPTLMAHCGLIGFSSQKLGWRTNAFYPGGKKYPFPVGLWEGIDGSKVMMVHGYGYGQRFKDEDLTSNKMLLKEMSESSTGTLYRYYGTGDTGGSPDINSVRALERSLKGNGPLQIVSATSDQIYKDYLPYSAHPELPQVKGEMTMDVHGTGCYTSQAAMKLYNRQNERLGDAAERAAVTAELLGQKAYPQKEMTENWRRMIWNQFHDDLPGTCIPRAYEFAWNDELITLNRFGHVLESSVDGIQRLMDTNVGGQPVVVYNTESVPTDGIASVLLPQNAKWSVDKAASQIVTSADGQRRLLFNAKVPATGAAVFSVKAGGAKATSLNKSANQIENAVYKVTVNEDGDISSIVDKRNGRELVQQGKSFGLVCFTDCKSYAWPAWEVLKATIDQEPVKVNSGVKTTLVEQGAVRTTLLVERSYGDSKIKQYIHLYNCGPTDRIDVENVVDWHSLNALLKANFAMNVSNPEANYDLGLGHIARGNNRPQAYEVYSHDWTDLTAQDGSYGITIMNDSKYGWDKPNDNTLRLSLLFSPAVDKGYTYQDRQDLGHHVFTYSIVGHEGQLDAAAAVKKSAELNAPLHAFFAPKHKGELGRSYSFVSSDNGNVSVRALKKAETGDDYILRVYENSGKAEQKANITFAQNIAKVEEADGTEKALGTAADFSGKTLRVSVKPFSVKTYRISFSKKALAQPAYADLKLNFDRRCFSPDGFRNQANFEGGYSYAAELLPNEGITVDGVPFHFGDKDSQNGLTCKGDTIKVPAGYNKVYLLAAATTDDQTVDFLVGKTKQTRTIPNYTGFIGQWGHEGQSEGYYKDQEVAYVGTHRHSAQKNEAYEFTYMFKYVLNIPKGATQIILPKNDKVVIFSATLANEGQLATRADRLFRTNNITDEPAAAKAEKTNLLKDAKVVARTGEVNQNEKAENLIDGNEDTKWCDTGKLPHSVVFDLGQSQEVSGWSLLNAGSEGREYITRTCLLQGRNSAGEEWQTLDFIENNQKNLVNRNFKVTKVRYIRLYVLAPEQGNDGGATRIYELKVF